MTEPPSDLLDRYLRGVATADEQRALARQALNDPDLADLLSVMGLASAAVAGDDALTRLAERPAATVVAFPSRTHYAWTAALAAAAVLVLAVWTRRPATPETVPATEPTVATRAPAVAPEPVTASAEVRHPAFLSGLLDIAEAPQDEARFRAAGSERQLPKAAGSVIEANGKSGRVDVGALDGVVSGSELEVSADPAANLPGTRATVTRVFRTEARVTFAGDVRIGQPVQLAATVQLQALSAALAEGAAADQAELLRTMASRASKLARDAEARADARRHALTQLAVLSRRRGDGAAAEQYLREAAELTGTAPVASAQEHAGILNAMAAATAARGDLTDAEATLNRARTLAPAKSDVAVQVLNNLGAVAALRGDRAAAAALYLLALEQAGPARAGDRAIIDANRRLVEEPR